MADVGDNGSGRPWWESQLDWNLPGSLEDTLRLSRDVIRNIPATLSAYRLGKTSRVDEIEPDPVVKIGGSNLTNERQKITITRPIPRAVPPPPPLPLQPVTLGVPRGVGIPEKIPIDIFRDAVRSMSATYAKLQAIPRSRETSVEKKAEAAVVNISFLEQTIAPTREIPEGKSAPAPRKKVTLEQLLDPDFCDY